MDVELGEERLAEVPEGHARRRLPGAGPLQDVPGVAGPVLLHPGEIGVAWAWAGQTLGRLRLAERSHPLPVLRFPLGVGDGERDGATERPSVADPAQHLEPVSLELLPAAPPVAVAAAGEL